MIQISPAQVTPALRGLFDPDMPTMPRAFHVLDGLIAGQIFTNDPARPAWGGVYGSTFGTLYLGGTFDAALLQQLIGHLQRTGDVVIGRWPDDPVLELLPPQPDYDGWTLYYPNRSRATALDVYVQSLPAGCELRYRDATLFERSLDRDANLSAFGSAEQALARSLGYFLMQGDTILCEAATSPFGQVKVEVGVTTYEAYRGRGYATIACARLIQACEEQGYETWWDCAKQNVASAALARKLGYHNEREYRVLAWSKQPA